MSNNPFRTPQLSPQNTNASVNSRAGVSHTPISAQNGNGNNLLDSIPDEAPPPYTLSADTLEGETPIQVMIQEHPLPDIPPPQIYNSVPANIAQPSVTINNHPELSESRSPQPAPAPPAPPRHPSRISIVSPSNTTITSRRSASVSSPTSPVSPVRSRSDRLSVSYLPPSGPPPPPSSDRRTSQIYDPPSDLPPPPRRAVSNASSSRSTNNNNVSSRPIDDGRPTTTPVPGHPLLFQNKLLVYPSGYECSQCRNVGYRNNDPSHPCTKCWNKYARSYSGALAYAPFPSTNGGPSSSSNFQRPLPKLQPPHGTPSTSSSPSSSRPATQKPPQQARLRRRSQSESKLNGGNSYNGTPTSMSPISSPSPSSARINTNNTSSRTSVPHYPITPNQRPAAATRPSPHTIQPSPHLPGSQQRSCIPPRRPTSCISTRSPPTPQSPVLPGGGRPIIYQAGDPRIGGRLCWRCEGRGRISYFIFDSSTCETCGGIGRTFN